MDPTNQPSQAPTPPQPPTGPQPTTPQPPAASQPPPPVQPQPPTSPMAQPSPTTPVQENPTISSDPANPGDGKHSRIPKIAAIIVGLILVVTVGFFGFRFITNRETDTQTTQTSINSNQQQPGTNITLEYWGLWEPSSLLQAAFDDFAAANPGITVNYTQNSPEDYRERLQSALARGDGPDIFRFHNTWVPMLLNELDELPESIMTAADFQQTFYPIAASDLASGSSFVGIPLTIDGLGLYYNRDIFTAAGKSPPLTWDDLRATARDLTITDQNTIQRAGIALGTTSNIDHFSDILGLMLLQNGANPANPTNSLAKDAVTFYQIFATTDKVWDDTLPPSTFAFATQKAAMMIGPSWRAHEIAQINPSLDFAITPVPQLPNSEVAWASYWVEGVSASSNNSLVAWQLLKFLSSKEVLRDLYTQASNERLFGEPFSRVDMADQLVGDQYAGAYIQQAPIAKSWPMVSRTFDNGINDRIVKYFQDALNAGGGDPALETAASGVLQILSQYGVNAGN